MLVLSRRREEQIIIDGDIIVTVVDIRGDKVRIGIDAPKNVPVHRREIHNKIARERAAADGSADASNRESSDRKGETSNGQGESGGDAVRTRDERGDKRKRA